MDQESFVAKQLELLELERNAEIAENRCLHESSSLKDLQKKCVCILKLRLSDSHIELFGRLINTFEPFWPGKPLPCHNIKSGDIVGIGHATSDKKHEVLVSGVVTHVKEESISVALEKNFEELPVLESDVQYLIIKLANDVTYKRLKKALKQLNQQRNERSARLIDVSFGNLKPTSEISGNKSINFFNQNLNGAQRDAVKFALSQKEISLLHGPPGTGKTTVVVEIVMQAVAENLKVLVCAPSNVAVDNLVEKLSSYKVKMVRLGHPARVLSSIHNYSLDAVVSKHDGSRITYDLHKEINKIKVKIEQTKDGAVRKKLWAENKLNLKELKVREKSVISEVLKQVDIVLCTLTSASPDGPIKHLPKEHFDITVIDECSQALEASCWIPIIQVPKCILAGDHHQLPPTIICDNAAKDGLEVTLMERLIKLHGNDIVRMLNIQYRMHQKIMEWSSKQFYDGKLEAHSSVISHLLRDIPGVEDNENTCAPLLLIDTTGCGFDELDTEEEESKGNEGEADLVSCHVENLVNSGVESCDIAVITPYNLQVDIIKCRLSSRYPHLEIKSVDGFQGREKEAIILSLVRCNTKGEVGFLSEDRRINVAITRAKRHLAIICSSETVSHHPFLKSFVDYITSEGEVRSASEYEEAIGHYPKFKCQSQSGKSASNKYNGKKKIDSLFLKEKNGGHKQNIRQQDFGEKANKSNECLNSQKDLRAEETEKYRAILKQFLENPKESVLKFSPYLNSFERRIVHEISEEFGILHSSHWEGVERYIEVKKVRTPEDEKGYTEKPGDSNETCLESVCDVNKDPDISSHDSLCSTSSASVPRHILELHSIHCGAKNEIKEKKKKIKTEAIKNKNCAFSCTDDDFDAIIEKTIKLNNTCAQDKCKKNVSTLRQECQFCRSRFCFSHYTPEVHGCSDAAKAHARRQLKKDGKLYPGSGRPQSSSSSVKHVQLQHKLNKKLEDLSNQRKPKPKT